MLRKAAVTCLCADAVVFFAFDTASFFRTPPGHNPMFRRLRLIPRWEIQQRRGQKWRSDPENKNRLKPTKSNDFINRQPRDTRHYAQHVQHSSWTVCLCVVWWWSTGADVRTVGQLPQGKAVHFGDRDSQRDQLVLHLVTILFNVTVRMSRLFKLPLVCVCAPIHVNFKCVQ